MSSLSKKRLMCHMENRHLRLCLVLLTLMLFSPLFNKKAEAGNSARESFNEGLAALNGGDPASAETSFLLVLEIEPEHAGAFYHLGVIALSNENRHQALQYLKQAARFNPELLPTFLRMAEAYEQQGNLEKAIQALDTASRRVKDSSSDIAKILSKGITRLENRIKVRRGKQLLRDGQSLEAKTIFQEVLLLEAENAEAHHFFAVSLGIEGHIDESIQHFETALRLKPGLNEARSRLIDLYLATAQLEKAQRAIESALFFLEDQEGLAAQTLTLQLDGVDDQIVRKGLMDKAMQQLKDKRTDEAVETFKVLIRIHPTHLIANFNMGILAAQQKKYEQAIPFFEKVIQINPVYRQAHERLAQIYELTGFYSRAVKYYEEALSTLDDKNTPSGKALKAMIARAKAGQVQATLAAVEALKKGNDALSAFKLNLAIQHYERASFLDREDAEIRYQLGLLYERAERLDLAKPAMRAAIQLSPPHLAAQRQLANYDEATGFLYQALKRREKIDSNKETDNNTAQEKNKRRLEEKIKAVEARTSPLMKQAIRLAEEDDLPSAIEMLKEARTLAPDDTRIRRALAAMYEKAGLSIKAFEDLSAARLFEPERALHYIGLARLYKNAGQWHDAELHFNKTLEAKVGSEGLKKEAEQGLNLVIKKQKDIQAADRYLKRARRYHKKEDYRTAIRWYEKTFRLFPNHIASLYWAATAYESLLDYKSAKSLYHKILKINNNNTLAHQRLGFISEIDGELEAAIQHYRANLSFWKGQDNRESTWVRGRLKPLEKRLHISLNQVLLSYDSNPDRSASPQPDLRSSAGIDLSYLLKKDRRLQIPIGFSSHTLFFFESNILFSQQSLSISAKGSRRPFSYAVGYNFQVGFAEGGTTGFDHITSLNLEWTSKKDYSAAFDLSFDSFISPSNKRFNAKRSLLRLSARKIDKGSRSTLSYSHHNNDANLKDQASSSHGLGLSYLRAFSERLTTAVSYDINLTRFTNIDSFAKKRRENLSQTASLGLSYQLEEGVVLNARFIARRNNSNLPTGSTITQEQQLAGQAASLGDYTQRLISTSMSWTF